MTSPVALLDDILEKLSVLPPETIAKLEERRKTSGLLFVPNPGGQTEALKSKADEMFFGGEPGGGKSHLLIGAAVTEHTKSIIFRREFSQIKGLEDAAEDILKTRVGYNAALHIWKLPTGGTMEFGSVPFDKDKKRYQGRAHDLKGFDEITHFTRAQYKYLTLWLRSADPKQRTRIIATGNPPDSPEGLWVIEHWAPWLDPTYHDPAMPGELRWAVPLEEGSEKEIFFRTLDEARDHVMQFKKPPVDHNGKFLPPRSRTFIPGKLEENPDYVRTGYQGVLAYATGALSGLASGDFESGLKDDPWQVIPTAWIIAAQERWTPRPPQGIPMVAIGVDVAQGGTAETVLAPRHDYWYAPLIVTPGSDTPNPSDVAALVVRHRRDMAAVVVDCDGGYGGGVVELLGQNNIGAVKYKGSGGGVGRTKDRTHGFQNKRAEAWWRFREALDPDQPGGSPIALPDDPAIRADLSAPRYSITPRGILIEDKKDIVKRIGRSPDKGDAIVMAWSEGNSAIRRGLSGPGAAVTARNDRPKYANVGYSNYKRRR